MSDTYRLVQFKDRSNNDSSVYPLTKHFAVIDDNDKDLDKYISEYNVNILSPGATDSSVYTLSQAINLLPTIYKHPGIKLTFNSGSGIYKTYLYKSGTGGEEGDYVDVSKEFQFSPFEIGSSGDNSVQQKGSGATSTAKNAVAIGEGTKAEGVNSFVEGYHTIAGVAGASGAGANHAEGVYTRAVANRSSHAEGYQTIAIGNNAHAEGGSSTNDNEIALNPNSTPEQIISAWNSNKFLLAKGSNAHAEGSNTLALNNHAHSEGSMTIAKGYQSHAEGLTTQANGGASHAEGDSCIADGSRSHAEGYNTLAISLASHAEGVNTVAGNGGIQTSDSTTADGYFSHAEGNGTLAKGNSSHAEGISSESLGRASHAEGNGTKTNNNGEHAEGNFNISISGTTQHTVGIGTDNNNRKNAHIITVNGKHYIPGVGGYTGTETAADLLNTRQDLATVINSIQNEIEDYATLEEIDALFSEGGGGSGSGSDSGGGDGGDTTEIVLGDLGWSDMTVGSSGSFDASSVGTLSGLDTFDKWSNIEITDSNAAYYTTILSLVSYSEDPSTLENTARVTLENPITRDIYDIVFEWVDIGSSGSYHIEAHNK